MALFCTILSLGATQETRAVTAPMPVGIGATELSSEIVAELQLRSPVAKSSSRRPVAGDLRTISAGRDTFRAPGCCFAIFVPRKGCRQDAPFAVNKVELRGVNKVHVKGDIANAKSARQTYRCFAGRTGPFVCCNGSGASTGASPSSSTAGLRHRRRSRDAESARPRSQA